MEVTLAPGSIGSSGGSSSSSFGGDGLEQLSLNEIFTDDNYGLLNAAKFKVLGEVVTNETVIVTAYPSAYTQTQVVLLALIMTAMMVVIVVGNLLVVIAIATENNLTSVQNWFIASLAASDLLIGLVIMPFSLAYELMGYWMFGEVWCEIHAATDVLLCTASIMNICLISLDRYWSITRAIDYLNARTPSRVALMVASVWALSALISIPPLLGWKDDNDLGWFHDLLYQRGNNTAEEFLAEVDTTMGLGNFTTNLEAVVYPQCRVSHSPVPVGTYENRTRTPLSLTLSL